MSQNLLSPKLFFRDLLVNFISGVAGAALVGILSGQWWLGFVVFCIIVLVLFFARLWNKYERMIKLLLSGKVGYYYSFDLEESPKVWEEARRSFCYLGISADSIMEPLRRWIEKSPVSEYRILLMNPESKYLRQQEAFERGHDLDVRIEGLPADVRNAIDEAAAATSSRVKSAVEILKGTKVYRTDGRMKIRFYDEFSPSWMYLVDDRKAYIGILEKGKRGSSSPVMVIGKKDRYTGPFDLFRNQWERLWDDAIDA
ncbi:MAG: hypothetical protein A4E62_00837 [Syntrophorhabdus sp. PtaU1.Bin002]|nr:MAG: hypothetical protein A4E62_00837 [Syntrophorhabdus sp. PtaU1.Bin002]